MERYPERLELTATGQALRILPIGSQSGELPIS